MSLWVSLGSFQCKQQPGEKRESKSTMKEQFDDEDVSMAALCAPLPSAAVQLGLGWRFAALI